MKNFEIKPYSKAGKIEEVETGSLPVVSPEEETKTISAKEHDVLLSRLTFAEEEFNKLKTFAEKEVVSIKEDLVKVELGLTELKAESPIEIKEPPVLEEPPPEEIKAQ